jgi:hypothetical protein
MPGSSDQSSRTYLLTYLVAVILPTASKDGHLFSTLLFFLDLSTNLQLTPTGASTVCALLSFTVTRYEPRASSHLEDKRSAYKPPLSLALHKRRLTTSHEQSTLQLILTTHLTHSSHPLISPTHLTHSSQPLISPTHLNHSSHPHISPTHPFNSYPQVTTTNNGRKDRSKLYPRLRPRTQSPPQNTIAIRVRTMPDEPLH